MNIKNILFATSEAYPLIKTGGLADVSGSLPTAIKSLHRDIRIIMPAYREALNNAGDLETVARLDLEYDKSPVNLLSGTLPGSKVPVLLVDSPQHFDRPEGPYTQINGKDWPDNAERFTAFARAVVQVATNQAGIDWQPDIVHCNDWQTGLVPALLQYNPLRPATVFTIHNLAYQGLFPLETFYKLDLPQSLWSYSAMEFHKQFSFIKGGLVFADWLNTVSPTYAREICTPELGCGLDGLLKHRSDKLTGILNGIDYTKWNPAKDPLIKHHYNAFYFDKYANKAYLQQRLGLPLQKDHTLFGLIGRLVGQKGFDLFIEIIPKLLQHAVQIVFLGSGDKKMESALNQLKSKYPQQIAIHIGYSEELAHQIEAGSDIFVMPSRFEPCGLNQIYSLRYGSVPVVRKTGGLADTVIDANKDNIKMGIATGFVFEEATSTALFTTLLRALTLRQKNPKQWKKIVFNGMQQNFSWRNSAKQYLELYQKAIDTLNDGNLR